MEASVPKQKCSLHRDTIRSPAIAEKADRTVLSHRAVQHADEGYSRRGNFGGSLAWGKIICNQLRVHVWAIINQCYFSYRLFQLFHNLK